MKRTKNKNEEAANLLGGNFEIKSWMYQGYVILFTVNVLNGFSNNLSFYIINEYANDAFKDMYFPNATSNNTDVHTESCAAHNLSDEEKTMGNTVQEKVSQWSVYCSMCSGIPSLVSTTILASLSDRYGRKKMLFIALFGTLLKMSFCSFAIWFKLNIYLMLVTSVLEGCAGGWVTVVSISFAYVADLTRPGKQRSFVLAAFELVRNTGFYLGTISCGYLVDYCGFFYPSAISAGAILCAIILLLCLPETIQNTTANKDQSVIEIVKKQLKELFIILVSKSENDPSLRSKYHIGICALICIWMGRHGLGNVELYYILSSPICFNLESVSLYLTLRNFGQQLVTVVAVKLFQLCIQDEQTAIVSTVFGIAYYSSFGISKDAITLYIGKYCIFSPFLL